MPHHRLEAIVDEYGQQTVVTYGQQRPCSPVPTGDWHLNARDCFPQSWVPPGGTAAQTAVFNKYLAKRIEVRDPISPAADNIVTDYTYEDPAAWHHADDEYVPFDRQSWSDWRGYGRTQVTTGDTSTRIQVFRGMKGDLLPGDPQNGPGTRASTVTAIDGSATNVSDENWLAGQVIYEEQLSGTTRLIKTLRTYTSTQTAVRPGNPDPQDAARWVAPAAVTESRAEGGGFKQRRTTTTYNAQRVPSQVFEEGWVGDTSDDRCTHTSYAVNTSLYMLEYPSGQVQVSGNCSSSTEVRRSETAYDGFAVGVAPARGNPTYTRSRVTANTWNQATLSTYDELGRQLTVTNPNGQTTTTVYTPATGNPLTTDVTNHLGQTTHTQWNQAAGSPAWERDPNLRVTSYTYDQLGRTTAILLPTEQATPTTPSYKFTYYVNPNKSGPAIIRSEQLQSTSPLRYLNSWVLHDASFREQQTQTLSPASGKAIITQNVYDNAGRLSGQTSPQALPFNGLPGIEFLAPPSGQPWANATLISYDALSRPTAELTFAGSTLRWTTETSYSADKTTLTPPAPAARVETTTDAFDRVAAVREEQVRNGASWVTTTYGYNAAGDLTSVIDAAGGPSSPLNGNRILNTYDMLGRLTATDDPDSGDWTYAYDAGGNRTRTTDARGVQLHTTYDGLNRPGRLHRDGADGPLLAEWFYDAPTEAGLLDRSVRYDSTGQWTVDVVGYDARSRPTGRTWKVPAGIQGLSGASEATYGPVTYGYDLANHQTSMIYPAVGGLASEIVTTAYNSIGLPETMAGAEQYQRTGVYDDRGRPQWFIGGPTSTPFSRAWTYNADQRLQQFQAAGGSSVLLDHQFGYDSSGNVVDRLTALSGQDWRECFGYDGRQRLTRAFTTSGTCAAVTAGTGPQPYNHTYFYSFDSNLTSRVEGSTTVNYTYPASGPTSARPHAPTAVRGNSYSWDANGNQATRTIGGQLNTLTWDAEQHLSLIDDPDGDTSMVYDADGARLLRKTTTATTLYIEGHEDHRPHERRDNCGPLVHAWWRSARNTHTSTG